MTRRGGATRRNEGRSDTGTNAPLSAFDAVVWDLDGTLVWLLVDWDAVAGEVADVFDDAGIDATGADLWEMLDLADETGLRDDVEAIIAEHERDGAKRSQRLTHADSVGRFAAEGVCSLNCEAACRTALDVHDLSPHIDAVVGRDTVTARKPDPEPLLETVRRIDAEPHETLFVGDSARDAEAARRAGVAFHRVDGR
jgi:phosphoglycolate phosphatase